MGRKPKQTLLQKALSLDTQRSRFMGFPTNEEIEIALAWLKGDITNTQFNHAMGNKPNTNTPTHISVVLRKAVRFRLVEFKAVNGKK